MRNSRRYVLPTKVEQIRDQLGRWRRTRQKRSPIPEAIWDEAARLARECGVSVVSKALRLNYPDLKRRAQTVAPADLPQRISPPTFVELACGSSLVPAPCVVELENAAGVKMKITLPQAGGVNLAALVAAFGSRVG